MAIDLDNPSIAPPAATDLGPGSPEPGAAIAPPAAPSSVAPAVAPYTSAQDVSQRLSEFATDTLATPSRFDIPMVQQGIDLMDFELKRQGEQAQRTLAEGISARGLVSSSIDIESQAELARNLENQRQQRMFNLSQLMAQTAGQDRSAAANIGTQAVSTSLAVPGQSFEQQLAAAEFAQQAKVQDRAQELEATGMDQDEAFRQAQSEIQESQFGSTQQQQERIQNRAFELQQQGMDQDEAFRQAQSEIQETQFGSQQQLQQRALELQDKGMTQDDAFRRAQMEQQQGQFVTQLQEAQEARLQQLGLDTTGLAQSAQALKQQAATEGRSLDITEAYNKAEAKLRIDALRQEAEIAGRQFDLQEAEQTIQKDQYAAEHAQRRDQFADSLGLSTKQYQEEVDARMAEYGDRNAERLLNQGLQEGTLEHDAAQAALNRSLEREALKLQQSGVDAETAWREADRNLQETLETSAQNLQATGMSNEAAWRKAETEMAGAIQDKRDTAAAALQAAGITGNAQAALLDRSHALAIQTAQIGGDSALQKQADTARLKLETDLQAAGVDADKARALLDRLHALAIQKAEAGDDLALQKQADDARLKLETDLEAAGAKTDVLRAALDRTHAVTMQTSESGYDLALQKQADEARLKLEMDLQKAGAGTDVLRAVLDRKHDQVLQNKRDAIQQKGYDSEEAWRDALNTHEKGQRTKDRIQETQETERKLETQENIAREASFTAMYDSILQYAEGAELTDDETQDWLDKLEDMRALGPNGAGPNGNDPPPLTDAEMTANLDQTDQKWQQGWTKNANGKWFDASGAPTDYWHTTQVTEEDKSQWKGETDGNWRPDWTKGDDGYWYDGDHSVSAKGEKTDYQHSTTTQITEEEKAQQAQWMTETDGNWADDWTIDPESGEWFDGDFSESAKGEPTGYYNI